MIDDRPYMRAPAYRAERPVTVLLLYILGICFLFQCIAQYYIRSFPVIQIFGLSLQGLSQGYIFQLLTFQFLHAPLPFGLIHIGFNAWGIYLFGRAVEESLGKRTFLLLYLISGVMGGILQMAGAFLLPSHFGGSSVVGASAGLAGLLAAYCALFPDRQLSLLFPPVTLTARHLLWLSIGLAVFGLVFPSGNVAHGAHLGGLLMGIAYIRWIVHSTWTPNLNWARFKKSPKKVPTSRELVKAGPGSKGWKGVPAEELEPEDYISKEIDPILDKISAHGLHSLSPEEKRTLEAARAKMARK
ncbi:MAG: rhomboid family intramembrane serine protease [Verrucomicrobiota bacterium]|nr:rhomboid family intramembrane serine protease [Verrucomicrobiota bacterium]